MSQLYGSLDNRLKENNQFCEEIKVGTGMTEYHYTDRTAYEVIAVKDQKHVTVRKYDVEHVGDPMTNNWKLISNEANSKIDMVKRGNYWYAEKIATEKMLQDPNTKLWVLHNGFDVDEIRAKGKAKKFIRMNVSFGVAEYYYDYEF